MKLFLRHRRFARCAAVAMPALPCLECALGLRRGVSVFLRYKHLIGKN